MLQEWQIDHREVSEDDRFSAYLEMRKDWDAVRFSEAFRSQYLSELEAEDPGKTRRWWVKEAEYRQIMQLYIGRHCPSGSEFPKYVEAVKRRLAEHGFTRSFQLEEDLKRQDKLATWIEYLHFEYCWHDSFVRNVELS